jgi:hypothetical protein
MHYRFWGLLDSCLAADELISRLEINENWKDSAVSNNLDIAAMRELSNFYYVVVQDGRYTDLLNSNPLAAADALGMKVSQEALDQLALMRQQLSSTAFNPAEVGNWGFALVVGIVVVGLIAIAVGPPPAPEPPPPAPEPPPPAPEPPPPAPEPPPPAPEPPPPAPEPPPPAPEPPPPPPDDGSVFRFTNEVEIDLVSFVKAFEATLDEVDKNAEKAIGSFADLARGIKDSSGQEKL